MHWLIKLLKLFTGTIERPSPGDWLPVTAIKVVDSDIIIDLSKLNVKLKAIPKVWVPMIPDSNSMDGVFDIGNNNILIAGWTKADHAKLVETLIVGDIAVYRTALIYAIHRIVEIGSDSQGKFYRFKGDNNAMRDPGKVRENEIEYISIGTIY